LHPQLLPEEERMLVIGVRLRVLEGSVASLTQHFGDELLEQSDGLAQLLQKQKDY
jgi:hypothetical protein